MNLVLFLRKIPKFGIYIVMFGFVARTFMQFFLVFLLMVVAFALAFYILFADIENVSRLFFSRSSSENNNHLWKHNTRALCVIMILVYDCLRFLLVLLWLCFHCDIHGSGVNWNLGPFWPTCAFSFAVGRFFDTVEGYCENTGDDGWWAGFWLPLRRSLPPPSSGMASLLDFRLAAHYRLDESIGELLSFLFCMPPPFGTLRRILHVIQLY